MAVRSLELGRLHMTAAGTSTLFSVASSKTAILKDLRIRCVGGSNVTAQLEVLRSAQVYVLYKTAAMANGAGDALVGAFMCFEPGDFIRITLAGTTPQCDVWASGALLSGVA